MADIVERPVRRFFVDKAEIQRIVREQNERMGFIPDPDATPQKAQQMMLDRGIRPEDNIFSRGIIAARDGRDEE